MVSYSNKTNKQLVDEILQMLVGLRVNYNFDYLTVLDAIKLSVREIYFKLIPYLDNQFVTKIRNVVHKFVLPREFIRPIRLVLYMMDLISLPPKPAMVREARYVDPKEFAYVGNWVENHSWNLGTIFKPVYTIWGMPGDSTRFCVYIYPNDDYRGIIPQGYYKPNVFPVDGELECYVHPPISDDPNEVVPVPFFALDLLQNLTLEKLLIRIGLVDVLSTVVQSVNNKFAEVINFIQEKRKSESRVINSFVPPTPPVVSEPEQKTEQVIKGNIYIPNSGKKQK